MLSLSRWLLPFVCSVILLVSPVIARAPAQENIPVRDLLQENTLVLLEGNTLMAVSPPALPKISILSDKIASVGGFYWEVVKYHDWDTNEALAVLLAESGGIPNKVNRKDYHKAGKCWGSFGGWQLACFRGTQEELFDVKISTQIAHELWQKEGWKPWGAFRNGSYKKFLNGK